jgi:hypothetical protein
MKRILFRFAIFAVLAGLLAGCMAARSPLSGSYSGPVQKNQDAPKVSVFFLFRNMTQEHGMDSIAKLKDHGIKDFNNLFRDSLSELGNVARYTTFFESPNDVNNPKRRDELAGFRASHDFTLEITFLEESSFRQQMLSGTISLISLTLIPMPYSWDYTITANLLDKKGSLVRSYVRKATLDNWVQAALIFAYPFHPLEGKREQIFAESLHDIFRQIEAEKVLK